MQTHLQLQILFSFLYSDKSATYKKNVHPGTGFAFLKISIAERLYIKPDNDGS